MPEQEELLRYSGCAITTQDIRLAWNGLIHIIGGFWACLHPPRAWGPPHDIHSLWLHCIFIVTHCGEQTCCVLVIFIFQGLYSVFHSWYNNNHSSPVCVIIIWCSVLQPTQDVPVMSGLLSSCLNDNKTVLFQCKDFSVYTLCALVSLGEALTKHSSRQWQLVVVPFPSPCPLHW